MNARSEAEIAPPHFSHPGFISSAMFRLALLVLTVAGKLVRFVSAQILALMDVQ
jgi:hypothetical protein